MHWRGCTVPHLVPGRKLEPDVDGLFHDPDSFSFAFGIMYFLKLTSWSYTFLEKNLGTTNVGHSSPTFILF